MSYSVTIPSTEEIRDLFLEMYEDESFVIDKHGGEVLEIISANFFAKEDSIFGSVNSKYIERELEWYLSESLSIKDFPEPVPEIWKSVSSDKGLINSNYGYLVFNKKNGLQFTNVVRELRKNSASRRAIMIYTNPNMHYQFDEDGMSDFICTNSVQYLIRDNHLEALVNMRSCDAIYGYPNDLAWQKFVHQKLFDELKREFQDLELGSILWNCGSLHIYEKHFYLVDYYDLTEIWDVKKSVAKNYIEEVDKN